MGWDDSGVREGVTVIISYVDKSNMIFALAVVCGSSVKSDTATRYFNFLLPKRDCSQNKLPPIICILFGGIMVYKTRGHNFNL